MCLIPIYIYHQLSVLASLRITSRSWSNQLIVIFLNQNPAENPNLFNTNHVVLRTLSDPKRNFPKRNFNGQFLMNKKYSEISNYSLNRMRHLSNERENVELLKLVT